MYAHYWHYPAIIVSMLSLKWETNKLTTLYYSEVGDTVTEKMVTGMGHSLKPQVATIPPSHSDVFIFLSLAVFYFVQCGDMFTFASANCFCL